MLTNPYPHHVNSENPDAHRIQCDVPADVKILLSTLRLQKGTTQLVVLNLLHNLINDLHDLGIYTYQPDGDAVLAALCRRRPIPVECLRLRRSSAGTVAKVSKGVRDGRGGSGVREGTTEPPDELGKSKSKGRGHKQPLGEETAPQGGTTEGVGG